MLETLCGNKEILVFYIKFFAWKIICRLIRGNSKARILNWVLKWNTLYGEHVCSIRALSCINLYISQRFLLSHYSFTKLTNAHWTHKNIDLYCCYMFRRHLLHLRNASYRRFPKCAYRTPRDISKYCYSFQFMCIILSSGCNLLGQIVVKLFSTNYLIKGSVRYFFWLWGTVKIVSETLQAAENQGSLGTAVLRHNLRLAAMA